MIRAAPFALLLLLDGLPAPAADGPSFPGETASLARRLEDVSRKEAEARAGKTSLWAEVLDELHALLGAAADELVPVDKSHSLQLRRVCQMRLARLPPEVLARHRARVEGQAKKWLDDGRGSRDVRLLRRVVDEAFCSESAATALDLLGDLAFERGDFDEAGSWWRLLAPLDRPASGLRHPDTRTFEAGAQAKQLLAQWFAGGRDRSEEWTHAVKAFRKRHPKAEGHLAGEKGLWWKRLLDVAERDRELRPEGGADDWPTFAGSAARNRILPAAALTPESLARLCRDGQHHRIRLAAQADDPRPVQPPGEASRSLAFAPIIVGRHALLADTRLVTAFDIATGKREVWLDATKLAALPEPRLPAPADLRYTLTAAGDCVLARLGAPTVRPDRPERETASLIVCLDREPDSKGSRLRWQAGPGDKHAAVFEGTPVAGNGQAYVAVTRFEGARTVTAIHCYALNARDVASPRWKRDVCTSGDPPEKEGRYRHHLLTLAGPHLVYCSHSGAVVGLDAATGTLVWGLRYRSVSVHDDPTRPPPPRDLNPCVYSGGLLHVAPADSDLLLCLDPMTGSVVWERERIAVTHLLGVGRGKLIFTTSTPLPGLRAVSAADGGDRGGWFRSGADRPVHSFGRGLLAGDLVVWPTLHHVYLVRQEDGEQPADPTLTHRLPSGNLAFGGGALVVAGRDELHLFAPPRGQLRQRKTDAEQRPASALAHLRLGTALADAGQPEHAATAFRAASRLTTTAPLRELARAEEHHALLAAATQTKPGEAAAGLLTRAAAREFPAALRRQALARSVLYWNQANQPGRAIACCRALLDEPALAAGHLLDEHSNPQTTRQWASHWLERLSGNGSTTKTRKAVASSSTLVLPLLRSWTRSLSPEERVLIPEAEFSTTQAHVFFASGKTLICRDAASSTIVWQRATPFSITWVARHPDAFLAGGAEGVSCLAIKDGAALWEYGSPVEGDNAPPLAAFRLAAGRLFFVQGRNRLFALDAETGRVLWTRRARASYLRPPDVPGRIGPTFEPGEEVVVVPDMGEALDARTGRSLAALPPAAPGIVAFVDRKTGETRWSHRLTLPSTLTGEPIQRVALGKDEWLLIVPRNHGTTLERVEVGRSSAAEPVLLRSSPPWAAGVSHDAEAVYFAHDSELKALGLDGKARWSKPLPGGFERWRTARAGGYLLAWPAGPRKLSLPVPLTAARLECQLTWTPEPGVPVLVCEVRTGLLVQQLNLPGDSPRLTVCRAGCPGEERGPRLALTRNGLLAASGGTVIHLTTLPEK